MQTLRINPFVERAKVEKIWCELEDNLHVSFFNSWGWISTWLDCLPNTLSVELIVNIENNEPVCCFLVGITHETLNKFKKTRAFLNNTGYEKFDDLVFEYNSILCDEKDIQRHLDAAINELSTVEEFRFFNSVNINFEHSTQFFQRITTVPSPWVDLQNINADKGYLSYISKNKRNQIKRSLKEYNLLGDVQIELASNLQQAKCFFEKLEDLHQKEWIKRGKPGAFAEPFFKQFHNQLIDTRFELGELQLIRIFITNDTGEEDIGYLYNFVFNNEILFYQSGFNYKDSNKYRPGLVSHYLAINECINLRYSKYNFLAGTTQYKQSLATNSDSLHTITLSRKSIKSNIEHFLRKLTKR